MKFKLTSICYCYDIGSDRLKKLQELGFYFEKKIAVDKKKRKPDQVWFEKIDREQVVYIELNTLEDILKFIKDIGSRIIIFEEEGGVTQITIYDDYNE